MDKDNSIYGIDVQMLRKTSTDAEFRKMLISCLPIHRWIPVTEKLPQDYEEIICLIDGVAYHAQYCDDTSDIPAFKLFSPSIGKNNNNITHWMPLPEPPNNK